MTQQIDRQREHQANERTFLAWLRTSIAMIGFGFAIARFGLFLRELQSSVTGEPENAPITPIINSQNLGIGLVIVGIIFIALAVWRYNRVFWQIEGGNYRPNRIIVWITAAVVMIFGVLTIPFVLWRQAVESKAPSFHKSGAIHRLRDRSSEPR